MPKRIKCSDGIGLTIEMVVVGEKNYFENSMEKVKFYVDVISKAYDVAKESFNNSLFCVVY